MIQLDAVVFPPSLRYHKERCEKKEVQEKIETSRVLIYSVFFSLIPTRPVSLSNHPSIPNIIKEAEKMDRCLALGGTYITPQEILSCGNTERRTRLILGRATLRLVCGVV